MADVKDDKKRIKAFILRKLYIKRTLNYNTDLTNDYIFKYMAEHKLEANQKEFNFVAEQFMSGINELIKEELVEEKLIKDSKDTDFYVGHKVVKLTATIETIIDRGYIDIYDTIMLLQEKIDYENQKCLCRITKNQTSITDIDHKVSSIEQKTVGVQRDIDSNRNDLKNFYEKFLELLGIMIAVFSIIGLNISAITDVLKFKEYTNLWSIVGSICIMNMFIILSMYLLFYLINAIVNDNEKNKRIYSFKCFIGTIILLAIMIMLSLILIA